MILLREREKENKKTKTKTKTKKYVAWCIFLKGVNYDDYGILFMLLKAL